MATKEEVEEYYSFDDCSDENYDGEGEEYFANEDEGDEKDFDSSENENEAEDESFKYSEELEYEDIGEPATFNFNIHNGKMICYLFIYLFSFLNLLLSNRRTSLFYRLFEGDRTFSNRCRG